MGTGSSRARKTRSCNCSPPRPWSGPRWGSGSSSAPAGQEKETVTPGARCSPASPHAAFGEPDSDSELLDEVLAEFGDERLAQLPLAPRQLARDSRSRPAGGRGEGDGIHVNRQPALHFRGLQQRICKSTDVKPVEMDCLSTHKRDRDDEKLPSEQSCGAQVLLTRSTAESNKFANQLPLKKPERQATISYDYSEEELMATIEQEYGR